MEYSFHPDAEVEHLEIVRYYESKAKGLGLSYLTDFDDKLAKVCHRPNQFPIEIEPAIRRVRISKFPYTVFYHVVEHSVQILAIAHYRREPNYWFNRV